MLSVQQCATLACLLDVTAPKPGNVHRGADFEDMGFLDFAASAVAIGPAMGDAEHASLGETVLRSIQDTRKVTSANTNLGIVLLLSPLAMVGRDDDRAGRLRQILTTTTPQDTELVYEAIRRAKPGGMGEVESMDIRETAPLDLSKAMEAAADRDMIAEQYVSGFEFLLGELVPQLVESCRTLDTIQGIVDAFVWTLATRHDSLIARKCGEEIARKSTQMAERAWRSRGDDERYGHLLGDLDFWLRSDGNRRNPGTTADLVTAALFVALLDESVEVG